MNKQLLNNLKRIAVLLCLILSNSVNIFAQEQDSVISEITEFEGDFVTSTMSLNLSILAPFLHFQYETPLGPKTVLDAKVGMLAGFEFGKGSITIDINENYQSDRNSFLLAPLVSVGVKHFYNIEKRYAKGRDISNNAANYFGGRLYGFLHGWESERVNINGVVSKSSRFNNDGGVALVGLWGMNRHLGRNFNFNLELGPSVIYASQSGLSPSFWLTVGFSKTF